MSREEFWRQYWDRVDVPVLGVTMNLPVPGAGCWTWTGAKNSQGYGVVTIQGQKWLAHRLMHHVFNEEIEPELMVLHSCNNTSCINPLHLRQGAGSENWDDVLEDYQLAKPVTDYMEGR
jgi:hypothetical protein